MWSFNPCGILKNLRFNNSMRRQNVITLMYHNIALGRQQIAFREWQPAYDVSRDDFLAQLGRIRAAGNNQITLTFDDGYRSLLEMLVELTERARIPCVCFITTAAIGQSGMLNRQEIRTLAEAGIKIGAHSHSHIFLENLTAAQLQAEVLAPQKILEDLTGQAVTTMSLPGGRYDRRVTEYAAQHGYQEMYASIPGARRSRLVQQPALDLVPRWAVTSRTSIYELDLILRGGRRHYVKHRMLYSVGRAGKFLLGNHGYHRMWQRIQHLTTSTRSEKVTS